MSETVKNNDSVAETESSEHAIQPPVVTPDPTVESTEHAQDPATVSESNSSDTEDPTFGAPTKRRRTSKVDQQLGEAKEVAWKAICELVDPKAIGLVHHVRPEEERLTTHLFECALPGYRGWFWFATLSRAPRSKVITVCEVGLLPGDDALLAPAWVPWAERMKNFSEAEKAELAGLEESEEFEDDFEDSDQESAERTEDTEDSVEAPENE